MEECETELIGLRGECGKLHAAREELETIRTNLLAENGVLKNNHEMLLGQFQHLTSMLEDKQREVE